MIRLRLGSIFTQFWTYLTWKYIAFVSLCLWAMNIQMAYRVPGRFLFLVLPWIGIALSVLSFILLANHFLTRIPADDPFRQVFRQTEWWADLLIGAFLCYSVFLYGNAKLDTSAPADHASEILAISGGEVNLGWVIPYSWAELRSWKNPEGVERLLLQREERETLWGGEAVMVWVRKGYFGLPWVSRIERDEEKYNREVLKLAPASARAWHKLILFYFNHRRPKEASAAAQEYFKIYPDDSFYASYVGSHLAQFELYRDAAAVLEPALARRPTYEAYLHFAHALARLGNNTRAVEALRAAISLNPEDPWAYYHMAYRYIDMGKHAEAIAMFEKVLERLPTFSEVERELTRLRQRVPAQRSTGRSK